MPETALISWCGFGVYERGALVGLAEIWTWSAYSDSPPRVRAAESMAVVAVLSAIGGGAPESATGFELA